MYQMAVGNLYEAWVQGVKHIWNKGAVVFDGEERLREILNLVLEVRNPTERMAEVEKSAPKAMIREIMDLTFKREPNEELGYSYGERMFNFKGIDQIQWAIDRLNRKPESKSASIGLLMPERDTRAEHIPCMVLVDFKKRDGKLNLTAIFRSHDYGKKALPNFVALGRLLEQVSKATHSETGKLTCHSISAHIYESDSKLIQSIVLR